ncbi:MAG: hypothetical protein ACKOKB_07425 [Bacteroidota bacterium]
MRKIFLALFVAALMSHQVKAQGTVEIGMSSGITNYYGDLGHDDWFQANSTHPGMALTFRNFLKPGAYSGNLYRPVSAEVRLSWNRLQIDEAIPFGGREGFELRNFGRGIGFRNDLFGLSTHITYTYYNNPRIPLYMQPPAFFFFTGIGVYHGTPKADLFRGAVALENRYHYWPDGTIRDVAYVGPGSQGNIIEKDGEYETDLTDWYTEGGSGSGEGKLTKMGRKTNFAVPLGFGLRYGMTKQITLSVECGYYMFFSDFIDDVSDRYPTYSEIASSYPGNTNMQELALYISDPSGLGRGNPNGVGESPRGNPASKDAHSFIGLELAYKFDFRRGVQRLWGAK